MLGPEYPAAVAKGWSSSSFLSASEQTHHIDMDTHAQSRECPGEIIYDFIESHFASASLQDLDRDGVGREHAFPREQNQPPYASL
jgi:hypothetical protein